MLFSQMSGPSCPVIWPLCTQKISLAPKITIYRPDVGKPSIKTIGLCLHCKLLKAIKLLYVFFIIIFYILYFLKFLNSVHVIYDLSS